MMRRRQMIVTPMVEETTVDQATLDHHMMIGEEETGALMEDLEAHLMEARGGHPHMVVDTEEEAVVETIRQEDIHLEAVMLEVIQNTVPRLKETMTILSL